MTYFTNFVGVASMENLSLQAVISYIYTFGFGEKGGLVVRGVPNMHSMSGLGRAWQTHCDRWRVHGSIQEVVFVGFPTSINMKHLVLDWVCFEVRDVYDKHTQWLCSGGLSRVGGRCDIVNEEGGGERSGLWQ